MSRGFTLLELLVVIVLIGLLAAIVLASLSMARDRAKTTRANAEMKQLINAFVMAQGNRPGTLVSITGMGCSDCVCRPPNAITDAACIANWEAALVDVQGYASEFGSLSRFARDPWGNVYLLDENELENPGDCRYDTLHSAGRDGIAWNADDIAMNVPHHICP